MPSRCRDLAPGRERLRLEDLQQLEQARGRGEHAAQSSTHRGRKSPSIVDSVASDVVGRRGGAMYDAMEAVRAGEEFDFLLGQLERPQPAAARAPDRLGPVGGVRRHERRAPALRRARQRGRVPHRSRRRDDRHVVPLLRRRHRAVVDLLGRQPPPRRARSPGLRIVLRRHRHLRGRRHARGAADRRALHVVARADTGRRAGSRPSRPTAGRRGS